MVNQPFGSSAYGRPVADSFKATFSLPTLPSLSADASQFGARREFKAVAASRPAGTPFGTPGSYRGNLYPTSQPYQPRTTLPFSTTYPEPKLYDAGIGFPKGDQGPQMLRQAARIDGDRWIKSHHYQTVTEPATTEKSAVRVFRTPTSSPSAPFLIYQSTRGNGMMPKAGVSGVSYAGEQNK